MAVFPQSIVFKTSQDDPADIKTAASQGGDLELLRGEIVMGLESGRVQLYAKDINGNAVSLVPPVPGYDISGNSVFELADVTFDGNTSPTDFEVLTWSAEERAFQPKKVVYTNIEGRPVSLDNLVNPAGKYITKGDLGLKGGVSTYGLNNVNKSQTYDDNDIPNGVYLQYSSSLQSWEYVATIASDISSNSIFDLINVDNPNGPLSPPPTGLNFLRWNDVNYVPSRPIIEEDITPALGGDLEVGNNFLFNRNTGTATFELRLGSRPVLEVGRFDPIVSGNALELGTVSPSNKTTVDLQVVGYEGIFVSGVSVLASKRSPGNIALQTPQELNFYEYFDNQGNIRREYINYNIVLPDRPPETSGVIAVWEVSDDDLDRDMFGNAADRPTVGNPIETKLSYKKYDLPSLDDVLIDEGTLELNSVLAYQPNIDKWINVPASGPGDLTANSIGDLRDVTLTVDTFDPVTGEQLTVGGEITIDTVNRHYLNGGDISSSDTAYLGMDQDGFRGMSMAHFRTSDGLGSYLHVDRDRGIELNSYASMTRLTGDRSRVDNRPELRFHQQNPDIRILDADNNLVDSPFIGLKYPDMTLLPEGTETVSVTYNLPLLPPTESNQVLTCGPEGQWAWSNVGIDSIVVALGDLSDVDTITYPPADGRVLTYQSSTSTWVPLDLPEITSALGQLTDVSLQNISNDDYLVYNSSFQVWENQQIKKDWMLASSVRFQTKFSSATNSAPAVGYWTVNQPNILNTTLLKLNKTSDDGLAVGAAWINLLNEGVTLLFTEQDSPSTYIHFSINGQFIDQGGYYDVPVEVIGTLGLISGNSPFICSILAGSGGGAGGGSATLEGLDDVDVNALSLQDKEVLQYDKSSALWKAVDPFARTIGELEDVDLVTEAPEIGEALTWNGSSWVPGEGGGGVQNGEAVERLDVNATIPDLAPATDAQIELLSIGQSGQFVSLVSSKPAWVRFYSTAAARTNDASRSIDDDPEPGSGVLLEVVTSFDNQTVTVSPGTTYYNNDGISDDRIYVAVRNMDETDTQTISITVRVFAAVTATINKGRGTYTSAGPAIPAGGTGFQTLPGCGKMGSFISVISNTDSWIRFYSTRAARAADQGRDQLSSPLPGSGVLMEIVAQANVVYQITPQVGYFNGEADPTDDIYIAVDNLGDLFQAVVVTVEGVPLEGQILAAITGAITVIDGGSFGSG